jgi:hypothetical protein
MKSYNLIKKDINQLPLAALGRQFLALRDLSWKKHVLKAKEYALENKEDIPSTAKLVDTFRNLGSAEMLELDLILNRFADSFQLTKNASWFFPQCLARLAQIKLPRNESGLISSKLLLKEHYIKDNFIMGIYAIFMYAKRGTILKNQTSEASRNFCKLVPLIMSAYKQYSNVNYTEWVPEECGLVVDADLWEAMEKAYHGEASWFYECLVRGYLPEEQDWHGIGENDTSDGVDFGGFSTETILGWRNDALTIKTGEKKGTIRNPLSTYSMSPSEDNPMKQLDPLSRHMFLQTWCAHPDNRTKFMVLDPMHWDNTPKPLIEINFLHTSAEEGMKQLYKACEDVVEMPW